MSRWHRCVDQKPTARSASRYPYEVRRSPPITACGEIDNVSSMVRGPCWTVFSRYMYPSRSGRNDGRRRSEAAACALFDNLYREWCLRDSTSRLSVLQRVGLIAPALLVLHGVLIFDTGFKNLTPYWKVVLLSLCFGIHAAVRAVMPSMSNR